MASSSATATADTLISLKVNLDGTTRRFKLPLRDLGANVFEDKVRASLQIPIDTVAVIERYSDSATSYVTLTQTNIAVYKQLYRAAKAKQKLKLRITTERTEPVKEIQVPKPVTISTIEDEQDDLQKAAQPEIQPEAQPEAQKQSEDSIKNETAKLLVDDASSGILETVVAPRTSRDFPSFVKQWRARGNPRIHLRRDAHGTEVIDFLGPSTTTEPLITRDSSEGSSSNVTGNNTPTTLADLMRETCERELAMIKRRETRAKTMREFMARSAGRSSRAEATESPKLAIPATMQTGEAKETVISQPEDCVKDAGFIHANHRFVPIYEPLGDRPFRTSSRSTHFGISCDGPLCTARDGPRYIVGERYKCAVCHDTDFCANCEHEDGQRLPAMGDRCHRSRASTQSPEKPASPMENIVATPVQTVVDVKPTEQLVTPISTQDNGAEMKEVTLGTKNEDPDVKEEMIEVKTPDFPKPLQTGLTGDELVAVFKWDTIRDGSILPPNHVFEQTWVLRNEGPVSWPAGCAVKFVGGDYMGAVDPAHPAGIHELVSASESTVCYNSLSPGQEFPFTVLMRTPDREGKVISYWRLTAPDGTKFGHKLWCDIDVRTPHKVEQVKVEATASLESDTEVEETSPAAVTESRMIIPKLEHESPSSSIHEGPSEIELETETNTLAPSIGGNDDDDDFEDCGGQDDWAEESDNGFFTDEEYDILDASDEEFLFEQQKMLSRK
ncbi:hypothetical protein ONZ43_g2634 [Nemania bipapillata]|uniref:Uncharacterized protein n=1 Tax=Nemania bipapillata TaxID=110536 RepID=A0ACC2IZY4_9PEZI|nr:hypothetical protein ONZ43_g2634 [Nemania bipapillata]